ncbi:MAG: S41 family peptidase, partial [Caldilineaceae bacterium]
MQSAYYRYPTIHQESILFVTEDDLWSVARTGGVAHRLTSTAGALLSPALSPDGSLVAFVGNDEGSTEVYLMAAGGGPVRRMTFLGSDLRVLGWTRDGSEIIFTSNHAQPFGREYALYAISAETMNGEVRALPYGPARSVTFGPAGQVVLGRFTGEPANWKRYRGGTAGQLWIDPTGEGQFERFMRRLGGNITAPMWLVAPQGTGSPDRVYFVSDHEGTGNLYSCLPNRDDLRRHTDHEDFYVRNPSTDGRRIVYHAGADLYVFDPLTDESAKVAVEWRGMRLQRNRRFVDPARFLDFGRLHPTGRAISVTTRGKCFAFYNHDGPVLQVGQRSGVRYRLPDWLNDGQRLVVISDAQGEECLEVYSGEPNQAPRRLEGLEMGRPVSLKVSPTEDKVAIVNHRNELLLIDLRAELDAEPPSKRVTFVDRSLYGRIAGMDWSPDGQWLAYSSWLTPQTSGIRLYRLIEPQATNANPLVNGGVDAAPGEGVRDQGGESAEAGMSVAAGAAQPDDPTAAAEAAEPAEQGVSPAPALPTAPVVASVVANTPSHPNPITISRPVLRDVAPTFDPDGNHLYFLSFREFNPVYDGLHFDLGLPWGMRPYVITLRADLPNPFVPHPELDEDED